MQTAVSSYKYQPWQTLMQSVMRPLFSLDEVDFDVRLFTSALSTSTTGSTKNGNVFVYRLSPAFPGHRQPNINQCPTV
jgi:hypothetical protein